MLKAIRKRLESEKGFTLIELMVVVLIIAILLAIAIPTFLRIRRSAQDRAAQSAVSQALKSEEAFYNEGNEVFTLDGTELETGESSINYFGAGMVGPTCAGYADGPNCVEVTLISPTEVMLTAQSANGTYWALRDVEVAAAPTDVGTFYNNGGDTAEPAAAAVVDPEW